MVTMFGGREQEPAGVRCSLFSRDNGMVAAILLRGAIPCGGDVRWPFSVLRTKQDAVFYYPQQHSNSNTDYNNRRFQGIIADSILRCCACAVLFESNSKSTRCCRAVCMFHDVAAHNLPCPPLSALLSPHLAHI